MRPKVTVIEYGIGNIFSIGNALINSGAEMILSKHPKDIANAEWLILPGVGAFKDGIKGLQQRGLIESILQFVKTERPFLGICLGMQLMLDISLEFGTHQGLGIIPGKVVPIASTSLDGRPHKIPHIGWNALRKPENNTTWKGTILENSQTGDFVYFVHSFTAVPEHEKYNLAETYYNGRKLSAVIAKNNLCGTQFHPEKSGKCGLQIFKKFLEL